MSFMRMTSIFVRLVFFVDFILMDSILMLLMLFERIEKTKRYNHADARVRWYYR